MALLVIDSKDNGFLSLIHNLVNKFKGAKAELIETEDSISELEDKFLAKEIKKGLESGIASKKEKETFMNDLLK
ncbi:MAG: hypothetical protein K9J13_06375 [Saprospiraceae bacterium]|nr:hypothetical protein [Saprospiraceae bacterium]